MNTSGMDKRTRATLIAAATFLAPAVAVQAFRVTAGWTPTAVVATPTAPTEPAPVAPAVRPLSADQQRLAEYLRQEEGESVIERLASPMDAAPAPAVATISPDRPIIVVRDETPTKPAGELRLGGIMGTGESALAMVNGKVRRIGDEIEPGWRLTAIDAQAFTLTLTGPEGVEFIIRRD
ncbi:MAG: hypothetical protein ACT4PL_05420 [Phycisphaerales bacterium]